MLYRDRTDAGRRLGAALRKRYGRRSDVVVLGLPRGGVPVAYEVARALDAPLDVFVVRKLGVPGYEELAMGAIASGGAVVLNDSVVGSLTIPESVIEAVAAREAEELERREIAYRGGREPENLAGKTVILVDDGLATGASMRAAARAVRELGPARVIVAVPVGAAQTCEDLRSEVDDVICGATPPDFHSVGAWYYDFAQVGDEEVQELLDRQRRAERKLSA